MVIAYSDGTAYESQAHEIAGVKMAINRTPANDNKPSIQINPTPYEDALIDQSWKELGKKVGPKPPVLKIVPDTDKKT